MQIPDTVKILGMIFNVKQVNGLEDANGQPIYSQSSCDDVLILVRADVNDQIKKQFLLREVVKMISWRTDATADGHDMADEIAKGLFSFIRENNWILTNMDGVADLASKIQSKQTPQNYVGNENNPSHPTNVGNEKN